MQAFLDLPIWLLALMASMGFAGAALNFIAYNHVFVHGRKHHVDGLFNFIGMPFCAAFGLISLISAIIKVTS